MTFEQALKYFKSTAAMAAALNLKERSVQNWVSKGLDRRTQLAIQSLTNNKLKADKL